MTEFVPVEMHAGGVTVVAHTPRQMTEYLFDGYVLGDQYDPAPVPLNKIRATRLDVERLRGELRRQSVNLAPSSPRLGPVTTEVPTVTVAAPVDSVVYNKSYVMSSMSPVNGSVPAAWPALMVEGSPYYSGGFQFGYGSLSAMPRTMRFQMDGDRFAMYTNGFTGATDFMIYVDGRPASLTPYAGGSPNVAVFTTVVFPTKKVREIEVRSTFGVLALYTQNPHTIWRPGPSRGPRVLVMGDSWTSNYTVTRSMDAIYWNMGAHIGSDDFWIDAIGSTGYGVHSSANGITIPGTGPNRYLDRLYKNFGNGVVHDVEAMKPEMVVVHGGGANDLFKGRTVAQIIADATTLFRELRERLPNARLVFVEGFAPPGFTPATYNPDYVAIRQGLQNALTNIGVYYIDVATSAPWVAGTGRVGATTGVGNSDIYVANDNFHPSDAGHGYFRVRMAIKLRRVLADDGSLLNTLI